MASALRQTEKSAAPTHWVPTSSPTKLLDHREPPLWPSLPWAVVVETFDGPRATAPTASAELVTKRLGEG